jgi:hypothetical protein
MKKNNKKQQTPFILNIKLISFFLGTLWQIIPSKRSLFFILDRLLLSYPIFFILFQSPII